MKLTEDQIKDLESRGINPGVKLRCPNWSSKNTEFVFHDWNEFDFENEDIFSVDAIYGNQYYVWLKCDDEYATPIE